MKVTLDEPRLPLSTRAVNRLVRGRVGVAARAWTLAVVGLSSSATACAWIVGIEERTALAPPDDAGPLPNGGQDGAADASPEGAAARARTLYVFGGVNTVGEYEQMVFEAYAAPILDDGSLGSWERAPALDVGRAYPTLIASPDGLLFMVGGFGVSIGQSTTDGFALSREDVSASGGDPLTPWRAAPPLGTGNGRYASAGLFASGRAYVGGGTVSGERFTDTVLAAPVAGTPQALQGWRPVGTLPFAVADHGLVTLGSRLYVLGGADASNGGKASASTSMTSIGSDGTLGTWTATRSLPRPVKGFGVVGGDRSVFVLGGADSVDFSASVFVGTQTETQDLVWQETSPLTLAREYMCVLRANGRLYAIGGGRYADRTSVVEVGEVSGISVAWRRTTPMPVPRSALGCVAR